MAGTAANPRGMLLFFAGGADPLLVLLLALALDLVVGGEAALWRVVPHPVTWVGAAARWLDVRLNREQRSARTRRLRGVLAVVVLSVAAAALGLALTLALGALRFGWAIEAVIVAILLVQKSHFLLVAEVAGSLAAPPAVTDAREAVARIAGRDPDRLDEHGLARAAIESLAANFSDGVVAPALWFALLGLPGLFVYTTASTLARMIGHRSPRYLQFGWAAARWDDLLDLAPARLAGGILCLAAMLTPRASGRGAFTTMRRDAGKHRSPNTGWPAAATAGALGLALAGPQRHGGVVVEAPWLGTGRARATSADIALALRLYLVACLVLATLVLALLAAFTRGG